MKLPMPFDSLETLEISSDTLKTLETANYFGIQNSISGNGYGYVMLQDAPKSVTRDYEISSETYSLTYILPGATLFRGQFSFTGQTINGVLRIPEDISYSNNPSSLLIYIHDEENEARSSVSSIYLSGGDASNDNFGPQISFENKIGTKLEYGDHFDTDGEVIIRLSDPLGINLTNETGHEIIIEDKNTMQSLTATNDFSYDLNSITTGTLNYSTSKELIHLNVRVWDNANNPSQKEIKLYRSDDKVLKIT